MSRLMQAIVWSLVPFVFVSAGCQPHRTDGEKARSAAHRSKSQPARASAHRSRGEVEKRSAVRTVPAHGTARDDEEGLSAAEAVQRTFDVIRDSVEFAPTLVVWLIDISPSAMDWGSEIQSDIRQFYQESVAALATGKSDRLQTAVLTFAKDVQFRVKLTVDPKKVVEALDAIRVETSGREATFEAIKQALGEYLPVRIHDRREVVFVVVSDEAGDDWTLVDQLIDEPRKYAVPFYVIGVPAPLGQTAALDESVESSDAQPRSRGSAESGDAWQPILQGPESRYLEMIQLELEDVTAGSEHVDSGYGPFALEWLCRASGGSFLAVRKSTGGSSLARARRRVWPSPDAGQFDRQIMRRYAPERVDEAGYRALLQGNQACMALHTAARLPLANVLRNPQMRLSEAERGGTQEPSG